MADMQFIRQKAQEIAFVVLRIGAYVRRRELRERLDRCALELAEQAGKGDFEDSAKTIEALTSLVDIGKSLYQIEPVNASILHREINSLHSAIRQFAGLEALPNIETLFSKPPEIVAEPSHSAILPNIRQRKVRQKEQSLPNEPLNQPEKTEKADSLDLRQSSLLERMKQAGNRQFYLKDVLTLLPEVSERTIRYDLQRLCGAGAVEKVGTTGPSTYYVIK